MLYNLQDIIENLRKLVSINSFEATLKIISLLLSNTGISKPNHKNEALLLSSRINALKRKKVFRNDTGNIEIEIAESILKFVDILEAELNNEIEIQNADAISKVFKYAVKKENIRNFYKENQFTIGITGSTLLVLILIFIGLNFLNVFLILILFGIILFFFNEILDII